MSKSTQIAQSRSTRDQRDIEAVHRAAKAKVRHGRQYNPDKFSVGVRTPFGSILWLAGAA